MRKLILVAALATMWTSTCHANLSLASNAPLSPVVAEAKAETKAETPDAAASQPKAPEVKAPEVKASQARRSSPRPRRQFSNRIPFIRSFSQGCL
jgi:hypothetical protein